MPISNVPNLEAIDLSVSEDRLSASLYIDPGAAPSGVDPGSVSNVAESMGIRLEEGILAKLTRGGKIQTRAAVTVARGKDAVPGKPAELRVTRSTPAIELGGQVDRVMPGDEVAILEGGLAGQDGHDVFGGRLPAPMPRANFTLGVGLQRRPAAGEDARSPNGVVVATVEGRLVWAADRVLRVSPLVDYRGDWGAETGIEDLGGDLRISGGIMGSAGLKVSGSVAVRGAVEAVRVIAGEDLIVGGGLLGRDRGATPAGGTPGTPSGGAFSAGRDVRCRFATGATVEAGRDVTVEGDAMHCRFTAGGRVTVRERLHGCSVVATGGIACKSVAVSNQRPTVLEAGTDPVIRVMATETLPELEGRLERLENRRLTIAPMLQRRDLLTPAQRQQAIRMIREATKLEREVADSSMELKARWSRNQEQASAEIVVEDVLSAGVIVRFPGMEATIPASMRGPLTVRPDRSEGEERVLIVCRKTGAITPLPARFVGDAVVARLTKAMAKIA